MSRFVQDAPLTKCAEEDSIRYRKRMKRFHEIAKAPLLRKAPPPALCADSPTSGESVLKGGFRTSTYYIKENPP